MCTYHLADHWEDWKKSSYDVWEREAELSWAELKRRLIKESKRQVSGSRNKTSVKRCWSIYRHTHTDWGKRLADRRRALLKTWQDCSVVALQLKLTNSHAHIHTTPQLNWSKGDECRCREIVWWGRVQVRTLLPVCQCAPPPRPPPFSDTDQTLNHTSTRRKLRKSDYSWKSSIAKNSKRR